MAEILCAYTELKPIHKLIPHPENPHKHSPEQIDRLAKLIDYQGIRHPIIVSNRSGFIVAGHGRLAALKKLNVSDVPIDYQDFDNEAQEYAFIVSDNAIGKDEWAALDVEAISKKLDIVPIKVEFLGIKDFQINNITEDQNAIEDEVPEPKEAVTVLGDIYEIGNHRLVCGDSTDIVQLEKLMNGEKADMVFTDPPYGVDYEGGMTKRNKLVNDHKATDIYSNVLPLLNSFSDDKAAFYIWHAAGYADMASKLMDSGFQIRSQIIWNKNMAQFGALSAQYKQKHEPCFYCYKKGNSPNWYGPTNEVTVWDMKRESKNEFHPTQKPVELADRALKNSSQIGNKILDLFGGSGSTLIACEKTNRKCFMMELDPHYCDVIVTRWCKYTGQTKIKRNGEEVTWNG